MKRALSFILTLVMLASLFCVPAIAYETAQPALWPSDWHADLNLAFRDATAAPLASLMYTQSVPTSAQTQATAINPDIAAQANSGALHLTADGKIEAATGYIRNILSAGQPDTTNHNFVTAEGSTMDLAVRFNELPTAKEDIIKIDANGDFITTGISSNARGQLGKNLGFVVNFHSASDFINPDGSVKLHTSGSNAGNPYSTDYYLSFVAYDNAVLGTNAAIIFVTGTTSSWTSWTSCVREVYFCNLDFGADAEYHRYTLTTDYAKGLEGEDMVTLYIDGVAVKTFSTPGYRNYSATTGDYVDLSLNLNGYCEVDAENKLSMSVSLDQLSIYGRALTPASGTMSTFVEEAPLYTDDYAAAVAAAKAMDATLYSKKTWKPIADALAKADALPPVAELNKGNATQEELDAITQEINSGIQNLRYNEFDMAVEVKRLLIPFSYFNASDSTGYAYAWTNSTILFTDPNYDTASYKVNGSALVDFMSIVFKPTATAGQYEVIEVNVRNTPLADRTTKAPAGGFILYTHNNIPGTSSSRYASQLFGDANAQIAAQIEVGHIAVLENVTIHSNKAAELVTSGVWKSRYDPNKTSTVNAPVCSEIMSQYPYSGTGSVTWQDQFDDFETISAIALQLPIGAFMQDFNRITSRISTLNETRYTEESWAALQTIVEKINLDDPNLNQDMIDEWTDELTAAYNALVRLSDLEGGEGNNSGAGSNTGDTSKVLITLSVMAVLAILSAAALIIGRRRGNI